MQQLKKKVPARQAKSQVSVAQNETRDYIFGLPKNSGIYSGNIENFIGLTQVPTGLIGPLKINGKAAKGSFMIPLATTEGALVASYSRGASAISAAAGAQVSITKEGLQRCPAFRFTNMTEAQKFIDYAKVEEGRFPEVVLSQSRHAELLKVEYLLLGNLVILTFWYSTGDAAGQNMVTFCTDAVCQFLIARSPVSIQDYYLESNMGGDKKATAMNMSSVRGKRLIAEVLLPKAVVNSILKSSPEAMFRYYQCAIQAALHNGAIGMQGHFANGLAALFLATGNDVACVAEAACGITKVELTSQGDLLVNVIIPSFVAGTLGGGTSLPTQQAALRIMECDGDGKSKKFAEISAGLVLAGELSIMAALAEGHFAQAHKNLGR